MKTVNRILVFVFVFVLIISIACIPTFAYTDTSNNNVTFVDQPIPYHVATEPQDVIDYGYNFFTTSTNTPINYYVCTNEDVPVYIFVTHNGEGNFAYVLSSQESFTYSVVTKEGNNDPVWIDNNRASSVNANSQDLFYWSVNIGKTTSPVIYCPEFYATSSSTARSNGFDAVNDWISNPDPSGPSYQIGSANIHLEAGNVAFIDVTNLNPTITLNANGLVLDWSFHPYMYSGTLSSIPESFTIPIAGTSLIDGWTGAGRADSVGRYSAWTKTYQVSGQASGHNHVVLCIAIPLENTNASGSVNSTNNNVNVDISVSSCNYYKIQPMKSTFSMGVDSSTSSGDPGTYIYDPETGTWTGTKPDGTPFEQQYGGDTAMIDDQSDSIHAWLERISKTISGFFTGAIGAVTNLVAAGSAFITQLIGLYGWLPGPVLSVLSSALILVITIGVIKVFI